MMPQDVLFVFVPSAITTVFLGVVISYYYLLIFKQNELSQAPVRKKYRTLSVIIPMHNERPRIAECISSVLSANFAGRKEIIVVDDGSSDGGAELARRRFGKKVLLIRKPHTGKADSLNVGLARATGELVAIVDGDGTVDPGALGFLANELGKRNVAAATGVVKVKNRKTFIGMWLHVEQLYGALTRMMFANANANVVTPGPLSMYRRRALIQVGGFSTGGFSEDVDITIRLIRRGYSVAFSSDAVSETVMPSTLGGFLKQKARFGKGLLYILRKHLAGKAKTAIDLYTLPLLLFNYIQAIVMGLITVYQIASGYFIYFASKGVLASMGVAGFLFGWLSIFGFFNWFGGLFTGATPVTYLNVVGIASTLLSYPLYVYAVWKFDKRFAPRTLIPLAFMFPFWLSIMIVNVFCLPAYFDGNQKNVWEKVN
ncbi:MAG: glycosyltransferase family 2 protein [archaeon]